MGEKWMMSSNGQSYCILANGELRRWAGNTPDTLLPANLIATLPTYFHTDPSLLCNAQDLMSLAGYVTVVGNQLTLAPPANFVGTFIVEASASDVLGSSTRTFQVTVTDKAPTLAAIADQSGTYAQINGQTINLIGNDADGDSLTYTAAAYTASVQAYLLDQNLGLYLAGSYYENAHGMGEKWMMSSSGQWYCILANGQLRRWAGTAADTLMAHNLIATFHPSFHTDPSLLWKAPLPTLLPNYVTVVGNVLTLTPPLGFVGTFVVDVTVSDGVLTGRRTFRVTVTG